VDDDINELERMIGLLQDADTDTTAGELSLSGLRHRCLALRDGSLSRLSTLLSAVGIAVECEREHAAIVNWMKDSENQLQALEDDRSLSAEDKRRQQEVLTVCQTCVYLLITADTLPVVTMTMIVIIDISYLFSSIIYVVTF